MLFAMRQPERRMHVDGEHRCLWIAWMNGALESAEELSTRSSRTMIERAGMRSDCWPSLEVASALIGD